jgi:hypothetical protein
VGDERVERARSLVAAGGHPLLAQVRADVEELVAEVERLRRKLDVARHNYEGCYESVQVLAAVLGKDYAQTLTPATITDRLIEDVRQLVVEVG